MMGQKRKSVAFIVLLLALSLVAGCGKAGGGQERPAGEIGGYDAQKLGRTLNLFHWSEYMPQEVLDGFEREYGVKVNYDAYSSNEEMVAKLQAGGGLYDIVVPSTFLMETLIGQDLLQPLDFSLIPNFGNIDDEFKNLGHDPGNKYTVPYMYGTVGIAYNTKYVTETPTSWNAVLDPKYERRLVVLDDSREILMVGLQAVGYSRNETDPDKIEEAKTWLRQMVPNVLAWDSDNPKGMFVSEDVWIGIVWNGEATLAAQENPAIEYVLPQEGGGAWMDSLVITKGAKNAYAAHAFINYLLRPEVAAQFGEAYPYGLPNSKGRALLPESIRNAISSYPPPEWMEQAEYGQDVGDLAVIYDRAYTEIKAGQ